MHSGWMDWCKRDGSIQCVVCKDTLQMVSLHQLKLLATRNNTSHCIPLGHNNNDHHRHHHHLVRRQFAGNNSKEGGQWWILSQPSDRNKPNWSQTRWLNSFESQILCSWSACLLVSCSYVTPVTPPRRFIDRYWRVYASRLWVALECWSRGDTNNIQNLIRVIRLKHTQRATDGLVLWFYYLLCGKRI